MLSKKEKSLKKFRWILILILTAVHISAEARNADTHSDKILSIGEENRSTTQEQADSIMRLAIGKAAQYRHTISMYEAEIYIKGRTEILKQNILMRLAHHIFPVDWRNKDMLFEMVSQSRYNAPYDYIHNIQAVNGNSVPNESKRQEALAFLNLNVYSPTAYDDAIFLPIAAVYDWNLVWFGVLMVILLNMGTITPPFGVNLFVIKELAKVPLKNGETIPTLRQYIARAMKQHGTKLIIDIKTPREAARATDIALAADKLVKQMGADEWVEYLAGYLPAIDALRRVTDLPVAYLGRWRDEVPEMNPDTVKRRGIKYIDYEDRHYLAHPEWVDALRRQGVHLNAWIVNDEERMDWFIERDFDYITTDEPEKLFEKYAAKAGK